MNSLSHDTITKLLKEETAKKKKDDEPMGATYKERWPGERNLLKLAKAVKAGKDFVVFTNGDRFSIVYSDENTVLVKPDFPKFVPMGYFSREKLKETELRGIDIDGDD